MPSPPVLVVEDLLQPIRPDEPAGERVPSAVADLLKEHRKEVNPADYAADDPTRPTDFKRADWPAIIELATKTLRESSKDLLTAARLTEALTKEHGFAGLRDGLHLLRRLAGECWDRILPDIEDGDLEVRSGPFHWLDDPDFGARFPTSVRQLPLLFVGEDGFGWQQWKFMQDGRGNLTPDLFEKALFATPPEQCQRTVEDLAAVMSELDELVQVLAAKMGELAPDLGGLRMALIDCQTLAQQIYQRKGPVLDSPGESAPPPPGDLPGAEAAPAVSGAAPAARAPRTRADVYRQLAEAANLLQQIEPHSPVPYLILRACELGSLPFPQLMRALIRDENILGEMNRELGIREAPPPPEE